MQINQMKTKLPKKTEPAPPAVQEKAISSLPTYPKTPSSVVAAAASEVLLESGVKRKSPDRDDESRKRSRPLMDITATDQKPPMYARPKPKVVEPVVEEPEIPVSKVAQGMSSEDIFSKQPPAQKRYTRSTQATAKAEEAQKEDCKVQ